MRGVPDVEIVLATSASFTVRNQGLVLQIGQQEFGIDPYQIEAQTLIFRLTGEEFARARDGDQVKVKYGLCAPGGVYFGRLNKNLLDH